MVGARITRRAVCALIAVVLSQAIAAIQANARPAGDRSAPSALRLYIGTYTAGKNSEGIYLLEMDTGSGKLSPPVVAEKAQNPSFLAIDRSHRFLYAVGEVSTFEGKPSGAVTAFAIDESGKLTRLNQQPSGGGGPCYVALDPSGRFALVANYGSGGVASLPIEPDGKLGAPVSVIQHHGSGPNPTRQTGPHAHSIQLDPAGHFAFAPDLGIDQVMIYRFDSGNGKLTPNDPPSARVAPGAGPRHFAFHPKGRFAYVANEMGSTVTAFSYNPQRGGLREQQTISMLPKDFTEASRNTAADIHVHPSGRFLYASNRGHDSIAMFTLDADTGRLTAIGQESTQGRTPRNFNIDPSGQWLIAANQDSDSLVVFRINPATGLLKPSGSKAHILSPVCIQFVRLSEPGA